MLRILFISDFNGNIAGQFVDEYVPLIHQLQAGLTVDLILLDPAVESAHLLKDIVYPLDGALFTGARAVQTVVLLHLGSLDVLGPLIQQVGKGLHLGAQVSLINRIVDHGGVGHLLQGILDVVKGLADAVDMGLVEKFGQPVIRDLQGIGIAGLLHLVPVLDIHKGIADLCDGIHVNAESYRDLGTVHIVTDRVSVVHAGYLKLLSGIADRVHVSQVLPCDVQPLLVGLKSGDGSSKTGKGCSNHKYILQKVILLSIRHKCPSSC